MVSASGQQGHLNLGPLVAQVKQRLVQQGFTLANRIPVVDRQITVFRSEDVAKARTFSTS